MPLLFSTDSGNLSFLRRSSDNSLFFDSPSLDNIKSMYTIVHNRKLYFYVNSEYYGFTYNDDKITLKLKPTIFYNKVSYFTESSPPRVITFDEFNKNNENDNKNRNRNNQLNQSKKIDLKRINSLISGKNDEESTQNDDLLENNQKNTKNNFNDKKTVVKNTKKQTKNSLNISDKNLMKKFSAFLEQSEKKSPQPEKKENNEKKQKKEKNIDLDIESDSNMSDNNILDLKIKTLDGKEKTFILKDNTDNQNLCLTYFKKTFILSTCKNLNNQIFKLKNGVKIVEELKKGIKKEKSEQKEDSEDIFVPEKKNKKKTHKKKKKIKEEEESSSSFKFIKKTKKEKLTKEKSNKHKENKSNKEKSERKKYKKKIEDSEDSAIFFDKKNRKIPQNKNFLENELFNDFDQEKFVEKKYKNFKDKNKEVPNLNSKQKITKKTSIVEIKSKKKEKPHIKDTLELKPVLKEKPPIFTNKPPMSFLQENNKKPQFLSIQKPQNIGKITPINIPPPQKIYNTPQYPPKINTFPVQQNTPHKNESILNVVNKLDKVLGSNIY